MHAAFRVTLMGTSLGLLSALASETNRSAQEAAPAQLSVELVDGSRIIGVSRIDALPVQTSYARISVPLARLHTLKIGEDRETATLDLTNGDRLQGVVNLASLQLATLFGNISIAGEHLRRVDVSRTGVVLPESLRKGLILYYSFDRDEKEKVSDNSNEHNDGVVHGATWTPNGKIGGAYRFDGSKDFLAVKPSSAMPDVGDFTVAIWTCVQPRELQVDSSNVTIDRQYILSAHSDAVSGQYRTGFCLLYDFKGETLGEIHDGILFDVAGDRYSDQTMRVDVAGKWHHLVYARRGTDEYTYLDGKLLDRSAVIKAQPSDPLNLNHTWSIGTFGGNRNTLKYNYSFRGMLDEVLVFRRALAAEEIKQLFELQK